MKNIFTLSTGILMAMFATGKTVSIEKAEIAARNYFSVYSGRSAAALSNSFAKSYNGITTYYVFNYTGGGFVVVAADDVATPILAQSNTGYVETNITNPSTRYWFDCYDKEIAFAVASGIQNTESLMEWERIMNNQIDAPMQDVGPLVSTLWSQDQWYNYYCPADPAGYGGKTLTGCVATAMGQIMKYHAFPLTGVGSHTYMAQTYGQQTVNFGTTNHDSYKYTYIIIIMTNINASVHVR